MSEAVSPVPGPTTPTPLSPRERQAPQQRACWRLLGALADSLDLTCADVIEVVGTAADAHMTLMARQFAGAVLERGPAPDPSAGTCEGVRVFWASSPPAAEEVRSAAARCDVLVIRHRPQDVQTVMAAADGLARIRAVRDAGEGLSVSVFGRGLARDIFRPGPASRRAA